MRKTYCAIMMAGTIAACTPVDDAGNAVTHTAMASVEAPQPLLDSWIPWNEPVAPFRIADNLHYVGAKNVSAFAVSTDEGVILIDTGFPQTAPQIEANLASLGMDLADVKIILTSHAHVDHVGGVAAVKARTGAKLIASAADAALMAAGGRGDFAFGDELAYPRVAADRIVADRETVTLGGTTLTAHITPGHTKGCTTWAMRAGEADILFPCGTSAPGYDLVDNAAYPGIVEDYRASFARMAGLPCDIVLPGHAETLGLAKKAATGATDALVDPAGCKAYIANASAAFEKELVRQQAAEGQARP